MHFFYYFLILVILPVANPNKQVHRNKAVKDQPGKHAYITCYVEFSRQLLL